MLEAILSAIAGFKPEFIPYIYASALVLGGETQKKFALASSDTKKEV